MYSIGGRNPTVTYIFILLVTQSQLTPVFVGIGTDMVQPSHLCTFLCAGGPKNSPSSLLCLYVQVDTVSPLSYICVYAGGHHPILPYI